MFLKIFIIAYLFIANGCACSEQRNSRCLPATYPVTPDWIFETETLPPADLKQNLTIFENGTSQLNVFLNNQREDFNLTLLANPFVENGSVYPELNTSDYNLRQYSMTCDICKVDNVTEFFYQKIFTGWHYFVMTNGEGKRWKFEPKFYETTYPFIDTRVKLKDGGIFKAANPEASMSYYVDLRVPLDCIVVRVKLYECKEPIADAIKHIEDGRIPATQSCWIKNIGKNPTASCDLISHIYVNVSSVREVTNDIYNNTWTVHMIWKNLTRGGGNYYLDHSNHDSRECEKKLGSEAVDTWRLIKENIYVDLSEHHERDEIQHPGTKEDFLSLKDWLCIICPFAAFIPIIILLHCLVKRHRLKYLLKTEERRRGIPKEPLKLTYEKESNQILLMYVNGCSRFRNELKDFKQLLRKHCMGYKIRDVYAASEFGNIERLGVMNWIHQQLKDGSKVIWFDTPRLRSCLNDKEKKYMSDDFRDQAALYTFNSATDQFRDSDTQYRHHFVVWLPGFQVDDQQDDPLKVISPHMRFLMPDHFADLCKQLNGPMECSRKHQNLYTEIKFESSSYDRTACMI